MKQSKRGMVEKIDFFTSFGHGEGGDHRQRLGITTSGPDLLITDLAIWKPDPVTKEFTVVSLHPGVTREQVQETCGWTVRFADDARRNAAADRARTEDAARPAGAHQGRPRRRKLSRRTG